MFCTNCGKELPEGTEVCSNCGFNLEIPVEDETDLNQNGQAHSFNCNCLDLNSNENNNFAYKHSKPLTTTNFFFVQILFMIPIINIFFIIYWSLRKDINKNLKSYARSMLIWTIIIIMIFIFSLLTITFIYHPLSFRVRIY